MLERAAGSLDRFEAGSATFLDWGVIVPSVVAALAVVGLAVDDGGHAPPAWGWSAVALFAVFAAAAVSRRDWSLSKLELAFLGSLLALGSWIWLSTAWSIHPAQTILEGQRVLVYFAAVLCLLALSRDDAMPGVLTALLAATTLVCGYGLATRLFQDVLEADPVLSADPEARFRLAEPLGYSNALGLLAVIGILLALGLTSRSTSAPLRAFAAAAPVVLAATLYFTFGRFPWVALAAGLLVMVALSSDRLQLLATLLALAPAAVLAVWFSSRADALVAEGGSRSDAVHDGRLLAASLVALALAAAAIGVLSPRLRRLPRRSAVLGVLAACAILGGGLVVAFGARTDRSGTEVSERLLSLSGSSRREYWSVAWRQYEGHPVLGSGAGTFERYWLEHRPAELPARDAHSLYLETLAELGPVGLGLLAVLLALPVVAGIRMRSRPLVPTALAAFAAYVVHAGADWDWEMPAVTLTGLLCGVSLVLGSRTRRTRSFAAPARAAAAAASLVLAGLAAFGFVGNRALAESSEALDRADERTAAAAARRATRWVPWSSEPWRLLGEAQLLEGDVEGAQDSFRRGLAKDGGDWDLWFGLALASEGDAQREALAQAKRLNPTSSELAEFQEP
jgi:O-Antigen ligase